MKEKLSSYKTELLSNVNALKCPIIPSLCKSLLLVSGSSTLAVNLLDIQRTLFCDLGKEFYDVPVTESLDCKTKGNYMCVLNAQRVLEIFTFWIPEDGVLSNMQLGQRTFKDNNTNYMSNVACFSLFKRKRAFPDGMKICRSQN